jgi:hypothetical protein
MCFVLQSVYSGQCTPSSLRHAVSQFRWVGLCTGRTPFAKTTPVRPSLCLSLNRLSDFHKFRCSSSLSKLFRKAIFMKFEPATVTLYLKTYMYIYIYIYNLYALLIFWLLLLLLSHYVPFSWSLPFLTPNAHSDLSKALIHHLLLCVFFVVSYFVCSPIPTHCKCRRLLFHAPQSVGLLWTSDQPDTDLYPTTHNT